MKEPVEIDLKDIFDLLKKKIWLIVLSAVLAGVLVFTYTALFVTPLYSAQISVYVNNKTINSSGISSSDLSVALQLVNTYVHILKDDAVLEKVIDEAKLDYSPAEVRSMMTAEIVEETEFFRVTIQNPDPEMAAKIANTIAKVAPGAISAIIEGSNAKVFSEAKVPTQISSPNYSFNTIIGIFSGAILAIAVIIICNMLDVRVRSEADLEKICPIPVLGMIPDLSEEPPMTGVRRMNQQAKKGGKQV